MNNRLQNEKEHIKCFSEIDLKAPQYYEKIIDLCKKNWTIPPDVTFLVVDHVLQTFESHLDSLSKLGKIAGVILKSSTRVKEAEEWAFKHSEMLNIIDVTKEKLKDNHHNHQNAIDVILKCTKPKEKLVILDHGGYFSYALKDMMAHPEVSKRLIGIAEVTENGHQKLEKALKETAIPNLSVAQSKLKESEDKKTGVAIVDATNNILLSVHATLSSFRNVCVIGYGKIGRSIASTCKKRGIPEVTVIEIDPSLGLEASEDGHKIVYGESLTDKANALKNAQVIFSATGSKALSGRDIKNLREDKNRVHSVVFFASCTSPDDEFSEDFFPELKRNSKNDDENRKKSEEEHHFSLYDLSSDESDLKIYVLNEGKAVNFVYGGTPGFEICQVWAGILYTAAKLAAKEVEASTTVQTLTRKEVSSISAVTLEVFLGISFAKEDNKPKAEDTQTTSSFPQTTLSLFHRDLSPSRSSSPRRTTSVGPEAPVETSISPATVEKQKMEHRGRTY